MTRCADNGRQIVIVNAAILGTMIGSQIGQMLRRRRDQTTGHPPQKHRQLVLEHRHARADQHLVAARRFDELLLLQHVRG